MNGDVCTASCALKLNFNSKHKLFSTEFYKIAPFALNKIELNDEKLISSPVATKNFEWMINSSDVHIFMTFFVGDSRHNNGPLVK